jgi:hypothetical protein
MTIDGPIRELRLDVVDICRKGITSPNGQNGICFRTSLPFAQPRLLLLLCQPTLTTFCAGNPMLYGVYANPRYYNRLSAPFDFAWFQQEHSKWNRNTFPIMCVPVVTNQSGSRCVQLLIRQQTLFLSLP